MAVLHGCKVPETNFPNGGVAAVFLAHLSRRLKGELIVYRSIRRPLVSPWVRG